MNIFRSKLKLAVGVTALAGVAVLTQAAPASAAVKWNFDDGADSCPSYICLWSENNYTGNTRLTHKMYSLGSTGAVTDMGKLNYEAIIGWWGMQDIASSIVNNTGSHVCFYSDNSYRGLEFKIGPWERWAGLPSWINDTISSFKFC